MGDAISALQVERRLARHGEELDGQTGDAEGDCRGRRRGDRRRRGRGPRTSGCRPAPPCTFPVASRSKGCRSRKASRPAMASTSAPVRITAAIGEDRAAFPRGHRDGDRRICSGRSGDAPINTQRSPSVRNRDAGLGPGRRRRIARARPAAGRGIGVPLRKAAARRRTQHRDLHLRGRSDDLGADVGVDLGAADDLDDFGLGPNHVQVLR